MVHLSSLFRIKLHGIWFKPGSKWKRSHTCFNSTQRINGSQLNLNYGTWALFSVDFASLRTWLPFVATPALKFRICPCKDKRYLKTFDCASTELMQYFLFGNEPAQWQFFFFAEFKRWERIKNGSFKKRVFQNNPFYKNAQKIRRKWSSNNLQVSASYIFAS